MSNKDRYRERFPVGDWVYAHMTEVEREAFRRFMRRADGRNVDDCGYCAINNCDVGVGVQEGERILVFHMRRLLQWLSESRLLSDGCDDLEWSRILRNATDNGASASRLACLFELASGIDDEECFDPDRRSERVGEWNRQAARLQGLGALHSYELPPAPVRPSLVRWAKQGGRMPTLNSEKQLPLALKAI